MCHGEGVYLYRCALAKISYLQIESTLQSCTEFLVRAHLYKYIQPPMAHAWVGITKVSQLVKKYCFS